MIDSTYEYLYNKGVEYGKAQAEIASKEFKNRCSVLINYVTPSKVKQQVPTKKTKPKKRVKENKWDEYVCPSAGQDIEREPTMPHDMPSVTHIDP